ncbi:cell wall-binding repeat-containing protein [Haloimpatiens sp. FM7315]|uniref:cell wall-binding repeat-containing protein n=1 Tax=Haloimpatiens sp. FM7315 TaxID=3298609 RepID=UPI0035A346B9
MKGKKSRQILSIAVASVVIGNLVNVAAFHRNVQAISLDRIGADNRYTTSSNLAKDVFGSSRVAVLVSGKGYQDAVSASPLAKQLDAPILLTYGARLEQEVKDSLKSMGVRDVYIIGGTGVISSNVEGDLRTFGCYTHRIGGKNKYETNLKIAEEVIKRSGQTTALMANGDLGYPDAISAAAIAANLGYPLLLTSYNKVPDNIKNFIKNKSLEVLGVGGTGVIQDKALASVKGRRVAAGRDRFDTNLRLLDYFKNNLNFDKVFVSCGGNDKKNMFADALIASAAAAKTSSPVVLSGLGASQAQINNANNFIKNNANKNTTIKIVGGKAVVSDSVENSMKNMFKTSDPSIIGSELPYDKKFVVIGGKAYSMSYYIGHTEKINKDLKSGTGMLFYCYKEEGKNRILNPNDKEFKTEEDLMKECGKTIIYYDNYKEKKYIYNGEAYKEDKLSNLSYNASIKSSSMVDKKIIDIDIENAARDEIKDARYFQIKGSPYIKSIDGSDGIQCMLSRDEYNRFNAEVWLLDYNKKVIAKGNVDLTAFSSPIDMSFKIDFQLVDENTINHSGNIVNGGMAVQKGNYIYYNNTGDSNRLYKMSLDGSFNRAIGLNDARYINAFENIIIYSNYKDNFALYKVNDDGTKPEKICSHRATYVNVSGNYIYYSNHSDSGKIYRIKINKSEAGISFGSPEKICDDTAEYLNVVGNTIYYSNYSEDHKLYAVNINGTGRVKLNNESSNFVNVSANYIYYLTDGGILKKIGTDGTQPLEDVLAKNVKAINTAEDYIYYVNGDDGNKIYKINRNSLYKEKVCEDAGEFINVTGDFLDINNKDISITGENIFYSKSGKLYKYDEKQAISSGKRSGQAVGKTKDTIKVSKVYNTEKDINQQDLNRSIKYIEDKYLPDRVSVLMSDDTVRELIVVWDKASVSDSSGVRTYKGEVIGYDVKAEIKLNRTSKTISPNQISIENNCDSSDILTARGFNQGDIIKVYKNSNKTGYISSSTVNSAGETSVNLGSSNLDSKGGMVWVTVTSSSSQGTGTGSSSVSSAESAPIAAMYDAEGPKAATSVYATDKDNTNFGIDGRDINVTWHQPTSDVIKQYIYLVKDVPGNSTLDYARNEPVASIYDNKTCSWTGSENLTKDSGGYDLISGYYKAFVVFENAEGKKSAPRYTTVWMRSDGTNNVSVYGAYFKNSSITLAVGEAINPEVVINPSNATNKDYYLESYNDTIVRVEGKTLRALATGTTTVKLMTADGNHQSTCTVTVGVPSQDTVTEIKLNLTRLTLRKGEKAQLKASVIPENVQNPNIVWSSDKDSVAKVSSTGEITAVSKGTALIKAKAYGSNVYETCLVEVVD